MWSLTQKFVHKHCLKDLPKFILQMEYAIMMKHNKERNSCPWLQLGCNMLCASVVTWWRHWDGGGICPPGSKPFLLQTNLHDFYCTLGPVGRKAEYWFVNVLWTILFTILFVSFTSSIICCSGSVKKNIDTLLVFSSFSFPWTPFKPKSCEKKWNKLVQFDAFSLLPPLPPIVVCTNKQCDFWKPKWYRWPHCY